MPILEVKNLTTRFGGLTALDNVSISIQQGEIHGLIGPNGAGKSTIFKNIAGFVQPTSGEVLFEGQNITGHKPNWIANLGVVRTFQETVLFQELSVFDNVLIGIHNEARTNVFSAIFGLDRPKQKQASMKAEEVLNFMGLSERATQTAGELPLGSKRALAIAISLASNPRLILLDEPFAGMNSEESSHVMNLILKVRDSDVTIILVEHNMKVVMGLCDRLSVLNFGALLAQGTPQEVRNNPEVISAYLGGETQ